MISVTTVWRGEPGGIQWMTASGSIVHHDNPRREIIQAVEDFRAGPL